jgi:hypothetical protein
MPVAITIIQYGNTLMANVTQYQNDDDGFSGSVTDGKLIKGQILRWNETNGWTDCDGLRPPEILLVLACTEALQRWKDKKPIETITTKPLPEIADLNAAVPQQEWEPGLDGKPKPPWVHQVVVYLIDPTSAGFFTFLNSTIGARIAWDHLRERVITMRALRGTRVVPLVKLSHRPMKTNFGMKHRPDFEIVSWRSLGADQAIGATQEQQRIAGPTPNPTSAAVATLSTLKEVEVPSTAEEIADKIPW